MLLGVLFLWLGSLFSPSRLCNYLTTGAKWKQSLRMLATLRETFWGVTAEWSRTSALSPEAAAAYVDENYAKFTAAREAFEACVRAHS